jgi:hypothetical protein
VRIQSLFALAPSIAEPLGRDSSQECTSSGATLSAIKDDSERLDVTPQMSNRFLPVNKSSLSCYSVNSDQAIEPSANVRKTLNTKLARQCPQSIAAG